jgi:cysteine-S-conjugate beta-lyase
VTVHHIDTTDIHAIEKTLSRDHTRLVLLESPTNPLFQIADIPQIVSVVRRVCGPQTLIVVDNTMMSPYLMNPLEMGVDIVYHSGTKYLSGHHDLMAGVVGVNDEALGEVIESLVLEIVHSLCV